MRDKKVQASGLAFYYEHVHICPNVMVYGNNEGQLQIHLGINLDLDTIYDKKY